MPITVADLLAEDFTMADLRLIEVRASDTHKDVWGKLDRVNDDGTVYVDWYLMDGNDHRQRCDGDTMNPADLVPDDQGEVSAWIESKRSFEVD